MPPPPAPGAAPDTRGAGAPEAFLELLTGTTSEREAALAAIDAAWTPGLVPMAIETLRFSRGGPSREALLELLARRTGEGHGQDLDAWWRWWWGRDAPAHPGYAGFKSALYANIDPAFAGYFDDARETVIRLDEARWGGVRQDGIPPLRSPSMIDADAAHWLDDGDIVFGIEVNGDARAYPKRILAWHEMFVDAIGGVEIAGVYCTLCGAVIPYETVDADGTRHALGTSGFLYRSNKLMYDRATQSLWSTTRGEPVVGPLVGEGIRLARRPVVTTTWREWRRRHPDTTVLDIDTGHRRDYGEGVAYRDYFATDALMFTVPEDDARLANKAEVLALRFPRDVPGRDRRDARDRRGAARARDGAPRRARRRRVRRADRSERREPGVPRRRRGVRGLRRRRRGDRHRRQRVDPDRGCADRAGRAPAGAAAGEPGVLVRLGGGVPADAADVVTRTAPSIRWSSRGTDRCYDRPATARPPPRPEPR